MEFEESVWLKVHGGREREALCSGCVYMPSVSVSVYVMEDILGLNRKEG